MEKSQTNATNVILPLLMQLIWGDIWKRTVEKSQTYATNVTMHLLRQAIWGHTWKSTVEKSQTNATCVTMHPLTQAIWRGIWKSTVEKSQINKMYSENKIFLEKSQIKKTCLLLSFTALFQGTLETEYAAEKHSTAVYVYNSQYWAWSTFKILWLNQFGMRP